MKADGGMLVQPSDDGSRPGYAGEDEVTKLAKEYQKVTGAKTKLANIKSRIRNNTITKELIDKYKSRGAYGSGFRGKEIEAVTNPKFYKTILSELNKVKKQRNKNVFFDYDDVIRTGKWYKNLRKKLGNLNEVDTDTIIKKVLSEEFPGSYYGKTGMRDFRRDKVVKAYLNYLDVNGSLDGGEKRLKELKIFQGTGKKQFRNINETFKEWTKGEFEVEGVDRKKLNPDQLKELKDWSPEYSSIKSVANEKQLKFLNDLNTNNPNLSTKEIRQKFFKQFPDVTEGAFNHRITHLTQLKNSGSYNQGGGNTRTFKWVTKGDRSPWLKELLGLKFQGNYSSFINRGDKLLEQGLTKEANRLYNAAEKYFGSNGVFTKFEGQGEHPFSRIFGSGPIGNELKINSLVRGDLNSFKRLNFDEPVIQLLTEYNKNTTTPERRNKIKTLIEDRKKLMNYLTESPKEKGIVESVKFNYGPEKMSVSANVVDIDKVKNFNPEDYVKRGESYLKSFETKGKNLLDDSGKIVQKKLSENVLKIFRNNKQKSITDAAIKTASIGGFDEKIKVYCRGKASGGRIGLENGTDICPAATKDPEGFFKRLINDPQLSKFFKSPKAVAIAKNVARAGLNATNPLSFIGGEIFYVGLDTANNRGKGQDWDEALDNAFVFYDFERTEKKIMEKGKQQGFDENQLDLLQNTMNLYKLDNRQKGIEKQFELDKSDISGLTSDLTMGSEKDYANVTNQLQLESDKYRSTLDKMGFDLSKNESYNTGFNYLNNIFRKKTQDDLTKVYDERKRKVDPEGGPIGDAIKPIFDMQSYTQPLKYAADIINPFTKDVPFETDRAREQRYLNEMDEKELYLYNKRRGFDLDSLLDGTSPYIDKSAEYLGEGKDFLGKGLFQNYASGGIASLTDTIPPKSGPTPHGLPSLMKRGIKIKE
jgi:hypothetical protein